MALSDQLNCNDQAFDFLSSKLDGNLVLDGAARACEGRQIGETTFSDNQLNVFQIAEIGKEQNIYLLHRDLFQSSFNQLFHLGRADSALFEMVYDDYPHARIFRLQTK